MGVIMFSCCSLMLWDEEFYDPRTGVYTVDAFLRCALEEYGGFDSLVRSKVYPNVAGTGQVWDDRVSLHA